MIPTAILCQLAALRRRHGFAVFFHPVKALDKTAIACYNNHVRGVAQLVARLLWEQDAAGSNPVTPTMPKSPYLRKK